jgi:hypothetical protein
MAKTEKNEQEQKALAQRRKGVFAYLAWLQFEEEQAKRKRDSEPEHQEEDKAQRHYFPGWP